MSNIRKLDVLKKLNKPELMNIINSGLEAKTLHFDVDRDSRIAAYRDMGLLSTFFIDAFEVDTGHKQGNEYHMINKNALIYIFNKNTLRLITILAARPQQIRRYYEQVDAWHNLNYQRGLVRKAYNNLLQDANKL